MAEVERARDGDDGVVINPVQLVVENLRRYPHVTYKLDDGGIIIDPPNPNGFSVWLANDDPDWIVHAGDRGGHWHFDNAETALEFLAFCLSEGCRLKIEESTFWVRSTLEARTNSGWAMAWQTAVFTIRLWKPKTVEVFENKLIPTVA